MHSGRAHSRRSHARGTPSLRRTVELIRYRVFTVCNSTLGITHSHTLPSTARKSVSGGAKSNSLPLSMSAISVAVASTSETIWVERMITRSPARSSNQVAKSHSFLRIEPHSRLIDDQEVWIVQKRLSNADALSHPPREFPKRARTRNSTD